MNNILILPKPLSSRKAPLVLLMYGPAFPGHNYDFEGEPLIGREFTPGTLSYMLEHPSCMYQIRTQDNEAIICLSKDGERYTLLTRAEAHCLFNHSYKRPKQPREWRALADFVFPANPWADDVEDAD
jgi:hypothetical protein